MTAALARVKAENTAIKERNRKNKISARLKNEKAMAIASGVLGGSVAAVGSAMIDARLSKPGKENATFGDSDIPIAPVLGLVAALGAIPLAKTNPSAAYFVGMGGMQAVNIGIYNAARGRMDEVYEDTADVDL